MQDGLLSLKTAIRTKDYESSKFFYTEILQLKIKQEYNDGDGARGCILQFGNGDNNALIEISEIKNHHSYYQDAFGKNIENDKIDLQLKTDNMEYWAKRIKEKWEARGPVLRPWGWHYLYLRDPDGLQIIIYQEK